MRAVRSRIGGSARCARRAARGRAGAENTGRARVRPATKSSSRTGPSAMPYLCAVDDLSPTGAPPNEPAKATQPTPNGLPRTAEPGAGPVNAREPARCGADVMDAIAVVNAGSSSIKFSLFSVSGDVLELTVQRPAEGCYTAQQYVAKNAVGAVHAKKSCDDDASLGDEDAIDQLLGFLRSELARHRLVDVGHRVVHGGFAYASPVRVDKSIVATLEKLIP